MNIQAYLQSGILEAYVLGALPATEAQEVAATIARYPELQAEVQAIEEAVLEYARASAEAPPPALMQKVWTALQADSSAGQKDIATATPAATSKRIPLPQQPANRKATIRWAQAAVWIGLVGSLVLNVVQAARTSQLSKEGARLAAALERAEAAQQQTAAEYAALQKVSMSPGAVRVEMKALKPGAAAGGTVLYQPNAATAYLALHDLPAPPAGRQYQLWIIKEGAPVDIGMVPLEQHAGTMMRAPKEVRGAEAFAVSLEPVGGSASPTADQILMLGSVKS